MGQLQHQVRLVSREQSCESPTSHVPLNTTIGKDLTFVLTVDDSVFQPRLLSLGVLPGPPFHVFNSFNKNTHGISNFVQYLIPATTAACGCVVSSHE